MKPEDAVRELARIVSQQGCSSEKQIYEAMAAAGVEGRIADRAYKFTQSAWGRVLLDGMGIQFSTDYICFNGVGEIIESGAVDSEPCFVAALRLANEYRQTQGFKRLALMSAEVRSINDLLLKGSKAHDLKTSTLAFFMERPEPYGLENAARILKKRLEAGALSHKPWWKFWG